MTTSKKKKPARKRATVENQYPNHLAKMLDMNSMSIGELARRMDAERAHISRLVAGHKLPLVTTAIEIARILKSDVETIWGDLSYGNCRRT